MADRPTLNAADLPAAVRAKLGIKPSRQQTMTKDEVRTHAIRVLNVIADLTRGDRQRVLQQAIKANGV